VTDQTETSTWQPPADGLRDAAEGESLQQRAVTLANERPEVAAGAAFAGGLVLAMILKRLGR
jgi:hypothetical protein